MRYGIIGAMPEEVEKLKELLTDVVEDSIGQKTFYTGLLNNKNVVLVCSGIGKVSASTVTAILITKFHCDYIINTGVAGGLKEANCQDIVLATGTTQHDFDLTIFNYKLGQVPGFDQIIETDKHLLEIAEESSQTLAQKYNIKIHKGTIVSGDQFIADKNKKLQLEKDFPTALATEMESAAIGEAAASLGVPYLIIRSISDNASSEANITFDEMLPIATRNSQELIQLMMANPKL